TNNTGPKSARSILSNYTMMMRMRFVCSTFRATLSALLLPSSRKRPSARLLARRGPRPSAHRSRRAEPERGLHSNMTLLTTRSARSHSNIARSGWPRQRRARAFPETVPAQSPALHPIRVHLQSSASAPGIPAHVSENDFPAHLLVREDSRAQRDPELPAQPRMTMG